MIADRVHQDHEVFARIHHVIRANERQQILRGATQPGRPENYVGPFGIQLSQCAVPQTKVANSVAALQLKIAELRELLPAFDRRSLPARLRCIRQHYQQRHQHNPRFETFACALFLRPPKGEENSGAESRSQTPGRTLFGHDFMQLINSITC